MKSILISLIFFTTLFAASAADKKPVIITGDKVTTRLIGTENNKKIYITEITGNPKIKYSGKELTATRIITRGSEGEISEAIGNVRLTDIAKKSRISAQRAIYSKITDIAEFTGSPCITTARDDDGSRVVIKADRLEYNIETDVGYAYGNVSSSNKDTNIHSEKAVFNRKYGTAVFQEKPSIRKQDDTYVAEEIIYYTDKKMLLLNRNARAVVYSEKKDPDTGRMKKTQSVITGDKIENYDGKDKYTVITGNASSRAVVENEEAVFSGDRIEIKGENNEIVTGDNIYIDYKADNIEGRGRYFSSIKNRKRAALRGDALLIVKDDKTNDETSRIYGDYMEFFEDINELHIFGNIRIDCDAGLIKGDMAKYNRNNNDMLITGNAMIEKEDSVLHSRKIIFNTKTNKTEMFENIKGKGIK